MQQMTTTPNPYAADLGTRDPLESLSDTPARIRAAVERWSDADFERSYAAGKWSIRKVLIHLTQTELAGLPELQEKGRFAVFDTATNGVRAIAMQLLAYQFKHALHTPRAWAFRWAPPTDHNDSEAYAANLAAHIGVGVDQVTDLTAGDHLAGAVYGIIHQENGRVLYQIALLDAACADALTTNHR